MAEVKVVDDKVTVGDSEPMTLEQVTQAMSGCTDLDLLQAYAKAIKALADVQVKEVKKQTAEEEATKKLQEVIQPITDHVIPKVTELAGEYPEYTYSPKTGKLTFTVDVGALDEVASKISGTVAVKWDQDAGTYVVKASVKGSSGS
jgi:hypothetical protein